MRILLTGAAGFIGRSILEKMIRRNYDILVLEKSEKPKYITSNIKWYVVDLCNPKSYIDIVTYFYPEVVIHLAWEGIPDFSSGKSFVNLYNSIKFIDVIADRTTCSKFIGAGSCFEYGKKEGACIEHEPCNILNYFSWAKHGVRQYLELRFGEAGKCWNWLRIFYVYGPRQRSGSLIPTLLDHFRKKDIPKINNPYNANDFVFIDDVASSFINVICSDVKSGIYNISSGFPVSVYDVCRTVEKLLLGGTNLSDKMLENATMNKGSCFWGDIEKSSKNILWKAETSIEEGIREIIIHDKD